ncbi:MAG: radical SAM protein [Planctomycetota bacterium]|nr:radical SAM protein [Planctomycetota bacterium]
MTLATREILKATSSLCPVCLGHVPAEVYAVGPQVFLGKTCPEHGHFESLISSDRRFYHLSRGAGSGDSGSTDTAACCGGGACDSGAGAAAASPPRASLSLNVLQPDIATPQSPAPGHAPGHDPTLIERAQTCIALIEIVESCNLQCPTCYADSPFTKPQDVVALPLAEFRSRIESVLRRKKRIDILQLSGGEPTIHPEFFDLLEGALLDQRIGYLLLNTNGVRLAQDDAFMARLGEMHRQHRRFEIYLQFDGPQEAGQAELRGADLRRMRERVVDRCGPWGIPVTLAMTVTPANLSHLGETVRFGLAHNAIRGISFQPMFGSGRVTPTPAQTPTSAASRLSLPVMQQPARPRNGNVHASPLAEPGAELNGAVLSGTELKGAGLNVADVILAIVEQSDGLLSERDFTPLPCGDPNCHTIGYVLRRAGQSIPVSRLVDFAQVQGFLKDRIDFTMADLERCGCESEPLGQILRDLEIGPDNVFRMFIKPFMDAWTYDQDRIDRCCVHVVGEDGSLESFCRHYALKGGGRRA